MILSPERMQMIRQESNRRANNLANDTEGNFTQADIDSIFEEGDRAIAKATAENIMAEIEPDCVCQFKNVVCFPRKALEQLKKEIEE